MFFSGTDFIVSIIYYYNVSKMNLQRGIVDSHMKWWCGQYTYDDDILMIPDDTEHTKWWRNGNIYETAVQQGCSSGRSI